MQAIQTRYKGYNFRSRLEARWAVAFDVLGLQWEYEPEGQVASCRLGLSGEYTHTFGYLPDFRLRPGRSSKWYWAEVKGQLDDNQDYLRCLDALASVTGSCEGPDAVILGPIPSPEGDVVPTVLHFHKGCLLAQPWLTSSGCRTSSVLDNMRADSVCGNPHCVAEDNETYSNFWRTQPVWNFPKEPSVRLRYAFAAARSARFEHGQSGATYPALPYMLDASKYRPLLLGPIPGRRRVGNTW